SSTVSSKAKSTSYSPAMARIASRSAVGPVRSAAPGAGSAAAAGVAATDMAAASSRVRDRLGKVMACSRWSRGGPGGESPGECEVEGQAAARRGVAVEGRGAAGRERQGAGGPVTAVTEVEQAEVEGRPRRQLHVRVQVEHAMAGRGEPGAAF